MSTPAGWYDDGQGRQRWWDGQQWTDQYADAQSSAGVAAPAAVAAPGVTAAAVTPAAADGAAKVGPLAWIGLAVAAVGFIFACIPGALIVGWILLPIGFILSIVALFLKGKKWPAITGLILAVVGTVVGFVVFFALMASAASDAFNEATSGLPSADDGPVASEPAEVAPEEDVSSNYVVTIDGATQTKDFEGKAALLVDYTFTNNSSEDRSFMFAVTPKAFQNGVELQSAILTESMEHIANALKDIKPGATIQVQAAYVLDDTSEVTVEVTELLSFDDSVLASKSFTIQ